MEIDNSGLFKPNSEQSIVSKDNFKVIAAALAANLGIAVAKFIGWAVSGSSALLAESIHSVADCANQGLLLFGAKVSKKPATKAHPFGYGRESFFWSFVVALVLFSLGGVFSIYEGIHKLNSTEELHAPWIGLGILLLGMVFEGLALRTCVAEIRETNPYPTLKEWYRKTTSVDLLTIFTEDVAALIGLSAASICLGIAWATNNPMWDAIGSIVVGVILVVTAAFLARETKSLIVGEAPTDSYESTINSIVQEVIPTSHVHEFLAQQIGVDQVMVSYKILPGNISSVQVLIDKINEIEAKVYARLPKVKWQFVEPDNLKRGA